MVRASILPQRDRYLKITLLRDAFRTSLDRQTGRPADSEADAKYYDKAEQYYRKAISEAEAGDRDPVVLTMKGRLLTSKRDYRGAIAAYLAAEQQMVPQDPARAEHSFYLADLYRLVGETGASEQRRAEMTRRFPSNDDLWALFAVVLNANGKPDQALHAAENALSLNPKSTNALRAELEAYRTEELDEDERGRAKARLQPESGGHHEPTARVRDRHGQGQRCRVGIAADLANAEQSLRAVLAKEPANILALRYMAGLLTRLDRVKEIDPLIENALAAAAKLTGAEREQIESNLKLLKVAANPQISTAEKRAAAEKLVAQTKYADEFARERDYVSLYMQYNEPEMALPHAEKAAAMQPDDPVTIDNLFRLGIATQKLDVSEKPPPRPRTESRRSETATCTGDATGPPQRTEPRPEQFRTAIETRSRTEAYAGTAVRS